MIKIIPFTEKTEWDNIVVSFGNHDVYYSHGYVDAFKLHTQIDYGSSDFATHVAARVPKFSVDQANDVRKLRLGTRPLAMPHNYCPWIYAAGAVTP